MNSSRSFNLELRRPNFTHLGIAREKKLRSQAVGGPWRSNCVDSAALLLFHLIKKLPGILDGVTAEYQGEIVTMKGAVIGVSSYRGCCCEKLSQGFGWNLHEAILRSKHKQLLVDKNFATLANTLGHIRSESRLEHAPPRFISGHASLEPYKHKLICTQS